MIMLFNTAYSYNLSKHVSKIQESEYLNTSPEELLANYSSDSTIFIVESNTSWTISKDADWLSVIR